jgi:hypothetical protein
MKTSIEGFIQSENIKNFKQRLDGTTHEARRRLLTLLAEEEAKGEQLVGEAETADLGFPRSDAA